MPGPLTGKTVADLHRLLRAAKVEPPYVLLGASFGGLIAHLYAATYPKEVVGMVLLDAAFPTNDRMSHDEWPQLPEQIDPLGVYQDAHALIGKEPAIPVTYLLAMPSSWTGPPAYEAVVLGHIASYVDRYSPGMLQEVESPTTYGRLPTDPERSLPAHPIGRRPHRRTAHPSPPGLAQNLREAA